MHVFALLGAETVEQVQCFLYQHLVAVWWQVGTVSRMLEHQAGLGEGQSDFEEHVSLLPPPRVKGRLLRGGVISTEAS